MTKKNYIDLGTRFAKKQKYLKKKKTLIYFTQFLLIVR